MSRTNGRAIVSGVARMAAMAISCAGIALAAETPSASGKTESQANRFVKDGVVVEFSARPLAASGRAMMEGDIAEVRFRLTDEATGQPLRGITPAAYMDIADVLRGAPAAPQKSCRDKIALYLRGVVGIRPMIDLNSYFVLVLNKEPSVTVIDPVVSMAGVTSTYANVPLKQPGADWTKSASLKSVFISMPKANEVAVIDSDSFELRASVPAGTAPTRVALQPDGRYLWVGNNATGEKDSGVSVLNAQTLKRLAFIATGAGHHEIAFTADSRHALVTNRDAGSVSVIDVASLRKLRDLATGPLPISVAQSSLSGVLYVADGKDGTLSVIDGKSLELAQRINVAPSLGPLRFTPDGRWAMVLNPAQNKVHIVDASSNEVIHAVAVEPQPFQITFTRAFAYVRALGSERVNMINLSSIGRERAPIVQSFAAGTGAPRMASDLVLADNIAAANSEAAVMVVDPVENTTYFYMEGMNAPASNYKSFGYRARAVTIVDRSLKEVEPGVYQSRVRMPASGNYDVAFLLNAPRLLHCFSASVEANPALANSSMAMQIEFLGDHTPSRPGETYALRFRLTNALTGAPRIGLSDVRVVSFLAPGRNRSETRAVELGGGVYEVKLQLPDAGAYYVHAAVPSVGVRFNDLPYTTIRVRDDGGTVGAPTTEPRS